MKRSVFRAPWLKLQIQSTRRYLSHFKVVEHVAPCSHTRYYPGTTVTGHENELKLAVKQYIPHRSCEPAENVDAVTIIGGHANGFPKELYEALWDDLYEALQSRGQNIRGIWIADIAQQGQSGVINESMLGDDANWWDHARDLLNLINQKQNAMPQPLVGIGHSLGASHLAALSLLHPRLLQSLVLVEPVIQAENPSKQFAPASTHRRDLWPSLENAKTAFKKSKFYQAWDDRVLSKWFEYGLRSVPTKSDSDDNIQLQPTEAHKVNQSRSPITKTIKQTASDTPVQLATTKIQELSQYLRPLYKLDDISPPPSLDLQTYVYPDKNSSDLEENYPLYRPEPPSIFRRLPELLPSVHYIFGSNSAVATPELRRRKMETTGTGVGGSGGHSRGRVKESVFDTGHMVPFERPGECADAAAEWIDGEVRRWRKTRDEWETALGGSRLTKRRSEIDERWLESMPKPQRKS